MTTELTRTRDRAPIRMLHLGLGNFFRAHQAWYTQHARGERWGIAAFTGRSPRLSDPLNVQDDLYTLLVRAADGDRPEVIDALSAVHCGTELEAWLGYWRRPELAIVTTTITEAGYLRGPGGGIDLDHPAVADDLGSLREGRITEVSTGPAKLLAGMMARARAGAPPLTVLPCDNLPANGTVLREVLGSLAEALGGEWPAAVEATSFATSMVDRITPATTEADRAALTELTGARDGAPVITEPFVEWVISGQFVAGHPDWDATHADDVEPHEQRKLWLLNGSHTLMAYAASARGHQSVSEAIADPVVRGWVEQWWDEACAHLGPGSGDTDAYRAALVERYENPRIRHLLAQIAHDGSQKVRVRLLPTLLAGHRAGRSGRGAARGVAAWIRHLQGYGAPVVDTGAAPFVEAATSDEPARAVLALFAEEFTGIDDPAIVAEVGAALDELAG